MLDTVERMAVAQGTCPNCGAPIEFTLGASLAKVCDYCRHTVVRTDRGLSNFGKAADLAHTPSLIAVGDEGSLLGRPFRVFGRVQLDHGGGPWDEYYVGFDYSQSWGWLAYAQGEWYATALAPPTGAPVHAGLSPEQDVQLQRSDEHGVSTPEGPTCRPAPPRCVSSSASRASRTSRSRRRP